MLDELLSLFVVKRTDAINNNLKSERAGKKMYYLSLRTNSAVELEQDFFMSSKGITVFVTETSVSWNMTPC